MCVVTVMRMAGSVKTPDAVIAGNTVGQILPGQPLQHPVNGNAVNLPSTVDPLLQFLMRQRALGRQQCGQNLNALSRNPRARAADHRFSLLVVLFGDHACIET
jgi:hypothetical protein